MPDEPPLPSAAPAAPEPPAAGDDEDEDDEEEDDDGPGGPPAPPARPPAPTFKFSTMAYVFLGTLGFLMLVDQSARNQIAGFFGTSATNSGPLYFLIGFRSDYLLLTMALAGAVEMLITAVAYNFTTDWVKAAKVAKWSSAFRKVQMEAIRSGKKDRLEALKPHQDRLTRLSGEVTIAQFKGMAITYFLLILIYTWVGLVITGPGAHTTIAFDGASLVLTKKLFNYIPWWFLIFSLYTVPFSMVFRRVLKHLWLRRYAAERGLFGPTASGVAGGAA